MPRLALFEDDQAKDFTPISLLRPVFELRCGHFSTLDRARRALSCDSPGLLVRPHLADVCRESHAGCAVNDIVAIAEEGTWLVNGRWLGDPAALLQADRGMVGRIDDEIAWLWVDSRDAGRIDPTAPAEGIASIASTRKAIAASGVMLHYPWDVVHHNAEQIERDFQARSERTGQPEPREEVVIQGDRGRVVIDPSAVVDPFVVIDARKGSIWIEAGARVLPFTRLEGPCYIGRESQLFRAHIRMGTSIGPVCRVGGEIEESIFHGYSNKYHDGFLGHSYVCPWVNLGALTTNSDLKNDYSSVRVPLSGPPIDTGMIKVGCFIGDHTKTALCSLFNTGSSIGVMTMLLPAGELMPKHIPSFSRLWHGQIEDLPGGIEPSLALAKVAMSRRGQTMTPAMEELLRTVYEQTGEERIIAAARQRLGT